MCRAGEGGTFGRVQAVDVLWDGERVKRFLKVNVLIPENTHGTGCTLASAIGANFALGYGLHDAVDRAKNYITEVIRHGLDIGKGKGPVNHFYSLDWTER